MSPTRTLDRLRARGLISMGLITVGLLSVGSGAWAQSNVLLIMADDLGVDSLGMYQEGLDPPITPVLDGLADSGVLFRNAWTNPNCSPSRAALLTGRYGFRTGIGDHIPEGYSFALPISETILPEILATPAVPYSSGAFGKWHLGNDSVGAFFAPNVAGFDHFDGTFRDSFEVPPPPNWISYFNWPHIINGTSASNFGYSTTINVDAASAWINQQTGPWFCSVWFHAPHEPFHSPPPALHVEDLTGLNPSTKPRPFYKAAIEAIDSEIGRLLTLITPQHPNTLVIFLGDNGSPAQVTIPPFNPSRAKGTLYEGGINVPLIISGPQVLQTASECQALVNITDLYATIADVAGIDLALVQPNTKLDSVSLSPYLTDPATPSIRSFVFAERFKPNGHPRRASFPPKLPSNKGSKLVRVYSPDSFTSTQGQHVPPLDATRAIRGPRYKLIVSGASEFYDLLMDPFETSNLLDVGLTPTEEVEYNLLASEVRTLLQHP